MTGWLAKGFHGGIRWFDRLERAVLTILMTAMVGIAAVQIILRNVWHTGMPWAEPLLGMALLWLTMLGALAAVGLGRHIAIDLATAFLPGRGAAGVARATSLFGTVVCVFLAWAAGRYVGFQREMDMGELLGWPMWKHYMVIPVVLWLMAARFAVRVVLPSAWLAAPDDKPEEGRGAS